MRAVMYHYVREHNENFPYFRYLAFSKFCRQLDYFAENFGFVEAKEWAQFVEHGETPKSTGKVVLTFDDGFIDHYGYVFKELKRRNLWGIFYVPAGPYIGGGMLDVHRVHLLCGSVKGADLLQYLLSLVSDAMIPDKKIEAFRKETYLKQRNEAGVSEVKRILNYFVSYDHRENLIDQLCAAYDLNVDPSDFYLSKQHIGEMAAGGMIFGSHSVNHPVMSKLSKAQQNKEISLSFDLLSSLCVQHKKTYCHPHGGFISFNDDTIEILESYGVAYSFNVESRQISSDDQITNKHHLPRFDCNEFAFGTAS